MEAGHVGQAGGGGDVGHHHGEKAVQAHAGGQGEGLVGQEGHTEHGVGGGGQKVVSPATISVRTVVPFSLSLKIFSIKNSLSKISFGTIGEENKIGPETEISAPVLFSVAAK